MTPDPESCRSCPFLYYNVRSDFFPACLEYFCGHDSLDNFELLGFVAVKPDWCPLEDEKPPPMHYMILSWDKEKLQWKVVHYTHLLEDFERLALIYPEPLYTHMIDVRWVKSHEVMKQLQEYKERIKKQQEELKNVKPI